MLSLTRNYGQLIYLIIDGKEVKLSVEKTFYEGRERVLLHFDAPKEVVILRGELKR